MPKRASSTADSAAEQKKRKPAAIRNCILEMVAEADSLISAVRIKKNLVSDHGMVDSKQFNTNVNKILKSMSENEPADKFGKIGGSYHGGTNSQAYLDHTECTTKAAELKQHEINGEIKCCYCGLWNSRDCFVREDSVARGGLHKCESPACLKEFWSWISDGYIYGHRKEYRFGYGKEDYAEHNKEDGFV